MTDKRLFMTYKTVSTAYRFLTLAVMASLFLGISSCSKDDEDSLRNSDIAKISSVVLGTVNCNPTGSNPYSYSAGSYTITVDDANSFISNNDSLVYTTDMKNVPVTFYTVNYGTVMLHGINGEESRYLETGSVIDLSTTRTFTVTSSNGKVSRDYTMKIVAHQQNGDNYRWTCVSDQAVSDNMKSAKTVFVNGVLVALQQSVGGTTELLKSGDNGATWASVSGVTIPLDATTEIGEMDGKLYVKSGNSMQYSSDLNSWSPAATVSDGTMTLKMVLGGVNGFLYGINDKDSIVIAKENGNGSYTWKIDDCLPPLYIDDDGNPYIEKGDSLPHSDINFTVGAMRSNSEVKQAFVIANKKNDYAVDSSVGSKQNFSTAVVWNKVIDPTEIEVWGLMDIAWNNFIYYLPRKAGLKAVMHNHTLVAMFDGSNEIYTSVDDGFTWKKSTLVVPDGFKADVVSLASKDKMLFITAYDNATKKRKVWRGYLERDMWAK